MAARVAATRLTLAHEIVLEFYFTCHKLRLNNNSSLYIKGKTNHSTMNWSTGKLLRFTNFCYSLRSILTDAALVQLFVLEQHQLIWIGGLFYFFTQMYQCFITKLVRAVGCHKPSRIAKMAMQHLMVECCWLQFSLYRYIQALPADPKRRIFSATTAFIASLADAMT